MFKKMTAWSALPKNERAKKRFGKRGLKPEQLMAIFRQCSDPKTSAKHIYFMVNGKPTPRRSARIRIKNERVAVHRILYEWFVEKEENYNDSADTNRVFESIVDMARLDVLPEPENHEP